METAGAEKEAFLREAEDAGYLQLSRVQVFKLYRVNDDLATWRSTLPRCVTTLKTMLV